MLRQARELEKLDVIFKEWVIEGGENGEKRVNMGRSSLSSEVHQKQRQQQKPTLGKYRR